MSASCSTGFWSYLPAFIAVAETEHLRRAAQALHVSPSALSRTIAMLEHRIGYSLFERSGRRLRLTPRGEQLLRVMRRSVSMLDETMQARDVLRAHVVKSSALG